MNTNDDALNAILARMKESSRQRTEQLDQFLATQPLTVECKRHPEIILRLDRDKSTFVARDNVGHAAYDDCPSCAEEEILNQQNERLHKQGVPLALLHATFDNWRPGSEVEMEHLETVKRFAAIKRGFLVMLGDFGKGKGHLAVASMRLFTRAIFRKQSTLLFQLRRSYGNREAEDPIEICQKTGLLVVDELGLSSGGRDELPMLHEILDHRYNELLPTILTSNVELNEFQQAIGARMNDRLKESAFAILTFSGKSHRAERRADYL